MKIEALHIGMKVEHPHHEIGVVKALSEQSADILFDEGLRCGSIANPLPLKTVCRLGGDI